MRSFFFCLFCFHALCLNKIALLWFHLMNVQNFQVGKSMAFRLTYYSREIVAHFTTANLCSSYVGGKYIFQDPSQEATVRLVFSKCREAYSITKKR